MEPVFLTLSEILEMHQDQIDRYGGESGVRDLNLLQSAVAMPAAGFGDCYLHRDLFEMAAAYLFHITQNHPFLDGNKRAGAVAAIVFLSMNKVELTMDEDSLESAVLAVAQGKWDKAKVAELFRNHSQKVE
jgi:death-on-curing protein